MLEQSFCVDVWPAKMSDDTLKHAISTDGILGDVLDIADENKPNVDLRCDLFSDISSDEITQMSWEGDKT